MKRFIAGTCLVAILLISPNIVGAQAASTDRNVLLRQIELLVELIENLQSQLLMKRSSVQDSAPRMLPPTIPVVVDDVEDEDELFDYPLAQSTWKSRFVDSDTEIPVGSFAAYYFDSSEPDETVFEETVDEIGISYAWDDGPGFSIVSEDFGGYWIGYVDVPKTARYTVNLAESWADARVLIDSRIISDGQGSETLLIPAGRHLVEAEFLNNWHTTDFAVTLTPERVLMSADELADVLPTSSDFVNWYIGAYESGNTDRTIDVTLRRSTPPVILTLATYSQVHWNISADDMPAAVIVASYEPGSTVSGLDSNVPVFYTGYSVIESEYSLEVSCSSYEGRHFSYCENIDQLTRIDNDMRQLTGREVDGFAGAYALSEVIAPTRFITDQAREAIEDEYESAREENESSQQNQTIDSMF